ncbi:T9SS type A sorting domain-containing protein [Hymenobacter lucidus]|uniref:T9SS type A sorting domain-containing protein n=1 Tax=Hymenobacter lucidus TaxID=2880930 RepID=A0ABS8AS91_9BACT|nr:T9SS type A sorting domain-containing protein [Hymenobacter lucidus]MCB2407571.1 T9SS type A sorting domain-containing protein [Hymenobacter lucidus]
MPRFLRWLPVLLLALGMASSAHAQTCDLRFDTQADLDSYLSSGTRCSTAGSIFIRGYNRRDNGTPDGGVIDVSGLLHITAVTRDVIIQKNQLASLAGLDNIGQIGGGLIIQSGVGTFDDFLFLVSAGAVDIYGTSFTEIRGFGLLSSVGTVSISQNPVLRTVNAFNNLRTVTNRLSITNNPVLENIPAFGSLTSVGDIQFQSNPRLQSVLGFNQLRSLGSVNITTNTALSTVSGFNGGLVATGQVGIMENPALETLSGFNNSEISLVNISRNPLLRDISNFNNSRFGVSIFVGYNAGLKKISGFNTIVAPQNISITLNPLLDSISGLTGSMAPYGLSIDENPALLSLGSGLVFTDYSRIGYLRLINNSSLATCTASWLCQVIARGANVAISGNAPTCTDATIRQACTTLAVQPAAAQRPAPYPNPADDVLQLPDRGSYRVSDLTGRVLLHGTGGHVSLTELPAGIYVVHTGAEFQNRFRIVKR